MLEVWQENSAASTVLLIYLTTLTVAVFAPVAVRRRKGETVRGESWIPWVASFGAIFAVLLVSRSLVQCKASPHVCLYPWSHLAVSLIFYFGTLAIQKLNPFIDSMSLAGFMAGTGFYLGREFCQAQQLNYVDWYGISLPLVGCLVVFVVLDQLKQPRKDD